MRRCTLTISLLALTAQSTQAETVQAQSTQAQTNLCQIVANQLWTTVANSMLHEQTPLAELTEAAPVGFRAGASALTKPGQSILDAAGQDHAVDPALTRKWQDQPPQDARRFGDSSVWLLDRVEGTLGCHTPIAVAVPSSGPAHEISLPDKPDPTDLCALSALTTVVIDKTPALWVEQSGTFSNSVIQSTVSIVGLHDEAFAPACTLTIEYAVTDEATHAFCDGVDCVPLIRTAQTLAMRLRQGETADGLAIGVISTEIEQTNYHRMAEIAATDQQPVELPTFGVSLDTPYTALTDPMTFPLRLTDGSLYLARIGHGGFGWRQTADTLLALYRLRDDKLVPAASVYVSARRAGISGVTIQ